jgi:hypothetical protein
MANSKISALPAASIPLAGTEVLPVVQGGVTEQVSVADLTAGSIVAATFTVTNSTVAATDTIILNQKSGTNLYVFLVTAVAAGSFNITFFTTGGIASDAPVINFSVIKAVTA